MSVLRGCPYSAGSQKNVPDTSFIDAKTKADMFTATKCFVLRYIKDLVCHCLLLSYQKVRLGHGLRPVEMINVSMGTYYVAN